MTTMIPPLRRLLSLVILSIATTALHAAPRNIVFILIDDMRYDAMGFLGHPFLQTPNIDSLARNGAYLQNAIVTTSLCSPSRASMLTGLYAHNHGVIDNNHPVRSDLVFYPQLLQHAGYRTGFFGKWHMGGGDAGPQRGFDRWVSFPGQGEYWPDNRGTDHSTDHPVNYLNVDGKEVSQRGYITDELTDYALDWMKSLPKDQPFLVYLSHKAVHASFVPADRYIGRYKDKAIPVPESRDHHEHAPMWAQNQRNSWHGVDYPYHTALDIEKYYQAYCETLLAVDDSVGRVLAALKERGQLEDTLIVLAGDNGFAFGEQGLIDKRTAYEASMRIPLLMQCPTVIKPGTIVKEVVANIDFAPTLLEAAGVKEKLANIDGHSFWPIMRGEKMAWNNEVLYEYFWERNFPQTPTLHAVRDGRYKYIRVQGLWDIDEFYDLANDPGETKNLIFEPKFQSLIKDYNKKLFKLLAASHGDSMPLRADDYWTKNFRRANGSPEAKFPDELKR